MSDEKRWRGIGSPRGAIATIEELRGLVQLPPPVKFYLVWPRSASLGWPRSASLKKFELTSCTTTKHSKFSGDSIINVDCTDTTGRINTNVDWARAFPYDGSIIFNHFFANYWMAWAHYLQCINGD